MSYITNPKGAQFSLFQTDSNQGDQTLLGQRFSLEDGRQVVLVKNGTVALASGVLTQHSPLIANHQNIAVVTYTPVSTSTNLPAQITATLGATKADENYYQGGLAIVNAGPGIGQTLKISASSPTAASGVITLTLEDAASVTLTSSSKLCLIAPMYAGVVINPTTATAGPAGITLYPLAASVANTYDGTTGKLTAVGTPVYGFIVSDGVTSCLSDVTIAAIGLGIMPSTTTAGAVTVQTATGANIGSAYQAGVSAEARTVRIKL
jgi:hypothetical protein